MWGELVSVSLTPPDPPLADELVRLRPWEYGDLACVRAAAGDRGICEATTVPTPYTRQAGRAFV